MKSAAERSQFPMSAAPRPSLRWMKRAALCIAISVVVSTAGFRYLSASPGPFVEDDSYFYAQIAYNLGTIHRSTFDGLHTTDGYHLLWGGILGAVSTITTPFTRDKDVHLAVFIATYLSIILLSSVSLGRSAFERALLIATGIWSAFLMESALLTLLLLWQLRLLVSADERRARDDLLLAVIPLCRIDATIIPLVWLLEPATRHRWADVARTAAVLTGGVALQLLLMRLCFGHWASVSSELKASHLLNVGANLTHNLAGRRAALLIALFASALFAAVREQGSGRTRLLVALLGPATFISIHYAANSDTKSWYATPVMACFVMVAFSTTSRRLLQVVRSTALVVVAVVVSTRIYFSWETWPMAVASRQFVTALRDVVPPNAIIFHTDGGGYVGYHSARKVINGDGLVNDHEYAHRLQRRELRDYLREQGVAFVIVNFPPQPFGAQMRRYGGIEVPDPNATPILESRATGWPGNEFWNFRLYRIQ